MAYLIGADIGTSGVKTVVIDERGRVKGSASVGCRLSEPKAGWAEQDPAWWQAAVVKSIRGALKASGAKKSELAALGLSGQMHGLVPLDKSSQPLRPAILWCDTRTTAQCKEIERRAGRNLVKWVANPALEGFTAPKILWMRDEEPGLYRRMTRFLLPKDYIRYLLTGEQRMEISDAAGTLLLDVKNRRWSAEMREALGLKASLYADLCESIDVAGRITVEAARATGLPEGLPVVGGGADNTCGAVGTGVVRPGVATSSIGSSGVIFASVDQLKVDPKLRVHSFNHSDPQLWYLMGCMLAAGLSFRWFRDVLCPEERAWEAAGKGDAYDRIVQLAQKAPAGSEGLFFMPYLYGERTPHKDALARGGFVGLAARHTRAHLARAVMEGIVFGLNDAVLIMKELGQDIKEFRAAGGGGKSAFWRQMQADIYGAPVVTLKSDEGPAFGAALLAGVGAGVYPSVAAAVDKTVKTDKRTEPNMETHRLYKKLHEQFQGLYPALKKVFHKTAEIVKG